jgi:hypothetical protein
MKAPSSRKSPSSQPNNPVPTASPEANGPEVESKKSQLRQVQELEAEKTELQKEISRLQRELAKERTVHFSALEKMKAEHAEALQNVVSLSVHYASSPKKLAVELSDEELMKIAKGK